MPFWSSCAAARNAPASCRSQWILRLSLIHISLVCGIAARLTGERLRTFAIGMRDDAIDLGYAREAADFLGSEHTEVVVPVREAVSALPEVIAAIGSYDITTVRASIGMYLVCKAIHEDVYKRQLKRSPPPSSTAASTAGTSP